VEWPRLLSSEARFKKSIWSFSQLFLLLLIGEMNAAFLVPECLCQGKQNIPHRWTVACSGLHTSGKNSKIQQVTTPCNDMIWIFW
jgi:hypothetical protein